MIFPIHTNMERTSWIRNLRSVLLTASFVAWAFPASAQISSMDLQPRAVAPLGWAALETVEAEAARDTYNAGRDLYDSEKFAEAEKKFREVLQKYPKSDVAERSDYYLIRTLVKEGKGRDAMLEISSFEKTYPKSGWYSDVEELRIGLTNQVTPALVGVIQAPPAPPPALAPPSPMAAGAPPAPPAPPEPYARVAGAYKVQQARAPRGSGQAPTENPEVSLQQEVLRVLFQQDADHAIDISTERLKSDPSDPVVLSNLYMVANSKSDKALPLLVNIAKSSPSDEARKDAIFWISRSHGDKDSLADTLMNLMPSLTSEQDSMSLVFALSQLNTPKSMDLLISMARDKNRPEKVRMNAVQWLGNSKSPNRLAFLEDIYKSSMDDVKIRRQVLQSIASTRDPAAVPVLSNVASTDPDQDTRREAVNALGQIKSPEALKALEDLLKKPQ